MNVLDDTIKKHNISIGKGHALLAQAIGRSIDYWILHLGASHHMTPYEDLLPSTSHTNISQITLGDSAQHRVLGLGTMQLTNGCINNVLPVPKISTNLLSIYQICHSGDGKTTEFSPIK